MKEEREREGKRGADGMRSARGMYSLLIKLTSRALTTQVHPLYLTIIRIT